MPSGNDKHSPRRLSHYQRTHVQRMGQFIQEGFVLSDETCDYTIDRDGVVKIDGIVQCLGGIEVKVTKTMSPVGGDPDDPTVETTFYRYNASVRGKNFFLRYDNTHPRPQHPDRHHKHEANWKDPDDKGRAIWVGAGHWPTFSEVMEEVRDWYWAHQDELLR